MTELILIRHAQTDWNAERRLQGHADRPLSILGRSQASGLRRTVARMAIEAVMCSDLQRTRETAMRSGLGSPVASSIWREIDVGRWSGRLVDDVKQAEGEHYLAWRAGLADPPGGESWAAFDSRVRTALASVAAEGRRCVAVVTHHGFIKAAVRIHGNGRHNLDRSFANASVTTINLKDGV